MLQKIQSFRQLPRGAILCTDFVGLYPNIPHEEGLSSPREFLGARTWKKLKLQHNSIFQINEKSSKQLQGAATALKFAPPYPIIFTTDLNEIIKLTAGWSREEMNG